MINHARTEFFQNPKSFIDDTKLVTQADTGPLWSLGVPKKTLLESSAMIQKREIKPLGVDYRGVDKKGRKWRFVGKFGETISYENASDAAAKFFDSMIDGMCWGGAPWREKK
jgi:hypothetical protein